MKRSAKVATFVLISSVLSGGLALLLCAPSPAPPSSRSKDAAEAAGMQGWPVPHTGWEAGTEYVHALDYHVRLVQEAEEPATAQGFELRARGQLRSLVSEVSADRSKVRYQLESAKLESAVTSAEALSGMKATEGALAQVFGVEYDAHGRALQLFVQPGLDDVALGIVRELIATTQLSLPETRAARYDALETDAVGEYRALYSRVSERSVQRQKTEYVRVAEPGGLRQVKSKDGSVPRIRAALARFKLDDWGRVAELDSQFEVGTPPPLDGAGPLFVGKSDVSLRFVSRGKLKSDGASSLVGLQATSLTPNARDFARSAQNSERGLVGDATPKALLSELEAVKADDYQAASTVQVRMSALVRQQPGTIAPLLSRLNAKNAPTVLGALGSAGTPEAQKALADVTRDTGREGSVRQAAVDSMLGVEHPTQDVPDALKVAMRSDDPSLRNNSSLMLGVVSRRMAEEEPEKAAALNRELTSELAGATDVSDRLRLLGSLGNSGGTEGLPQIVEALKSPQPALRAQAASSLRFVTDPQVDPLLSQLMVSDPVLVVRAAALGAAPFRRYDALASALEGVAKDSEASLRVQLVSVLTALAPDDGDALLLLDRLAQADTNEEVRAQAKQALERAGAGAQHQ